MPIIKKDVKLTTLSVIGGLCGIVGSLLSTARGGWVALPACLVCYPYIYRQSLSKRFFPDFLWDYCDCKHWH